MKNLDFAGDKALAKDFLTNFADSLGEPKYLKILQDVANRKIRSITIEIDDLVNLKLKECLDEYAALNEWQIHPNTFDIRFIDA